MKRYYVDVYYQAVKKVAVVCHTKEEAAALAEEQVERSTPGIEEGSAQAIEEC